MNWSILLLFLSSYQYFAECSAINYGQTKDPLTNEYSNKYELSKNDKQALEILKNMRYNASKRKKQIRSVPSESSHNILYTRTQEAFEKLTTEEKFQFLAANILSLSDTPEYALKKEVETLNKQKEEEKAFASFINFLFFVGVSLAFIYCFYLLLTGCSSQPQQVSSCPVRETNVRVPPTRMYHSTYIPPPTYDNIVKNTNVKL